MSSIKHKKTKFNDKRVQVALNVSPSVTVTTPPPVIPTAPQRSFLQNLRDAVFIGGAALFVFDVSQGDDSKLKKVFGSNQNQDINVNVPPTVVTNSKSSMTLEEVRNLMREQDSLYKSAIIAPIDTTAMMESDTAATAVKPDTLNL